MLHSFDKAFDGLGVLGLTVEVNFFGSELETDHTFHNIDRFLKSKGFELFDWPRCRADTCSIALERRFGGLLQGDALTSAIWGIRSMTSLRASSGWRSF